MEEIKREMNHPPTHKTEQPVAALTKSTGKDRKHCVLLPSSTTGNFFYLSITRCDLI